MNLSGAGQVGQLQAELVVDDAFGDLAVGQQKDHDGLALVGQAGLTTGVDMRQLVGLPGRGEGAGDRIGVGSAAGRRENEKEEGGDGNPASREGFETVGAWKPPFERGEGLSPSGVSY